MLALVRYPAEALRQTLRSNLHAFAVYVPQRTVHVDHSNDVVVSRSMPQ